MCYNCGCMLPDDDMGNPQNVTNKTWEELASKKGTTADKLKQEAYDALSNNKTLDGDVEHALEHAAAAWGQTIDEAKKNAESLLKDTLGK